MKKFIVGILLAFFCIASKAEIKREGNVFKVENTESQDTKTSFFWEDKDNNQYPIYITKKGACYVLKTSKKTGKQYKYYLPEQVKIVIQKNID
jgi:hypothetical protein